MSVREGLLRLSGDSLVYGIGGALGKAVQLLLVPVLTRTLIQQEFGVSDLVVSYAASAMLVLVFGMDAALARFFYEQHDHAARVRMASSSLWWRMGTTLAFAALIAAAAGPIASHLLGGEVYAKYVRLGAATLPFTMLVLYGNDVLRVTFQPWKFVTLNVAQTALVGAFTLWFVLERKQGVAGVLYGKLLGDAAAAALGLVLCRHSIRPRFDRAVLGRMLAYGLPLVPVSFAYGVIGFVDRYFLQRYATLEEVATYGVAMKFFALLTLLVQAFNLAFGPFAYARAKDPDAPRLFARVFMLFVSVGSLGALVCWAFAPAILAVLAPTPYAGAARPALWLCFAAVAQGAYAVAGLGVTLALRTRWLGWAAGGAALAATLANAVLTPRYGLEGAALSTLIGYTVSAVAAFVLSQRLYPLPFRGLKMLVLFAAALALGAVAARLAPDGAGGWVIRSCAVIAFAGLAAVAEVWKDRGAVRHRASEVS